MPSQLDDQIRALIDTSAPTISLREVRALRELPERPRSKLPITLLGIAAAVVVALLVSLAVMRDGGNGDRRSIKVADPPSTTITDPDSTLALQDPSSQDAKDAVAVVAQTSLPGSVRAVELTGALPIVVAERPDSAGNASTCVTIVTPPSPQGMQGACTNSPTAATEFTLATPDGQTWYFIWTNVPNGTARVIFNYGSNIARQKPLHGIAYFPVAGTAESLATLTQSSPPVARGYDANGDQIGEAKLSESDAKASADHITP